MTDMAPPNRPQSHEVAITLDNGGWREDVEARLDTVTSMVELNAEEPWEAEVHGLLCKAWRIMVDHREAKASG